MNSAILTGSKIKIDTHNGFDQIIFPHRSKNIFSYLPGVFLLFWFGGWAIGFISVLTTLFKGEGSLFLVFWLAGWSIAGVLVALIIYKTFRPSIPEKLLLNKPNLAYDTGKPPLRLAITPTEQKEFFKTLFKRRKILEFGPESIKTIQLRGGNRLTIDVGIQRLEIGKELTEIEREWLRDVLAQEYL